MYSPSCDGGAMTLIHEALRVPALGFGGIIVGACFLLYPAVVQSKPTPTKPNQVVATCEHGGTPTKFKMVADDGKSRYEFWCPEDLKKLPELSRYYSPIIPLVPVS